jgi:OFA family oxalate/formate antiporter-like MFS transporter
MKERKTQGWIIVAVLFTTMFLIWGPVNASSVFFLPVVKHFGWSRAFFSLLVATAPLAAGLASPVIGSLIDRYGERRIMIAGATMVGLSFITLSQANSAATFFVIFVVLGLGITASTIIPTALVITNWFREQRGVALGIAFAGIPLGGTAITIFANHIVQRRGFRTGYAAMAIPILFVVIPLLTLFMRKPPAGEKTRGVSDTMGTALPGFEVTEAVRTRSFWMIAIVEVFFATAGVGLRVHLVPFLTGIGYSPTLAAEVLAAMFALSAIGTFAIGPLADRLGGRVTLSLIFLVSAGGIAALLGASHLIAAVAFLLIFGLLGETPSAILPLALSESLGVKRRGTLLGLQALFRTLGFAAGPVIAGRIFDRSGSYTGARFTFIAMEIVSMFAMLATLPVAEEKARIDNGRTVGAEPVTLR